MLDEFRSTNITWDKATSRIYSPVTANASDENGRKLVVQIVNGGQVEDLTGATLHLYWETRDKAHDGLDVFKAVDLKKGEFELSYTTGMLSNQGVLNANLVLIDTVGRVVSERFKITVTEGIDNDAIQSENSFTTLTQALIDISNLEQNYAPRLNDLTAQLQQTEQELSSQLAQKATKVEVDTKVAQIVSGSPKGTYATLSALQTAKPSGDSGVYVVTADGKWYYWNVSTWTAGGVYQSTGILEKSITVRATDFIKSSSNIFNRKTEIVGRQISGTDGTLSESGYNTSDFIPIKPSTAYTYSKIAYIGYYGESKQFISRPAVTNGETLTSPSNASFIRVMYFPSATKVQVNEGSTLLPYEDFYHVLESVDLKENAVKTHNLDAKSVTNEKIGPLSVGKDNLINQSVTTEKADFIKPNSNLLNHETHTAGKVISATGVITDSAGYTISDFIEVIPNETYTTIGLTHRAYYDIDKVFLSRGDFASASLAQTFTTPSNAYYMRVNIQGTALGNERRVNKGDTLLPFEWHEKVLQGVMPSNAMINKIKKDADISRVINPTDLPMIDIPIDGVFDTAEIYDDAEYANFGSATTSAQVYQMYDDLMALYPDYITKQLLGNDAWGNPISLYKFTPHRPAAGLHTKYPKVFLTTGTHGYEHVPGLMAYLMFKDICEKWQTNSLLEALRFNVEFLIIPVVNPSGWNDYTRQNKNGVDLNRNFPEGWESGDSNPASGVYRGPSALSELETQYVSSVFDNHPDIDIMYDFHNFSGTTTTDFFLWIPTSSGEYVRHMSQMLISRMTRKWRKEYEWIPRDNEWFAGYTDGTSGAMIQDHAIGRGIKYTGTFEVAGRWWMEPDKVPYSTTHKVTAVETLVNWLLINLKELTR